MCSASNTTTPKNWFQDWFETTQHWEKFDWVVSRQKKIAVLFFFFRSHFCLALSQVNELGDQCAVGVAEALKVNKTLKILQFSGNQVGLAGAKALSDMFRVNSTLNSLWFERHPTSMSAAGYQYLLDGLKANVSVTSFPIDRGERGTCVWIAPCWRRQPHRRWCWRSDSRAVGAQRDHPAGDCMANGAPVAVGTVFDIFARSGTLLARGCRAPEHFFSFF